MEVYPSELLEVPTPLIAFMGNIMHHPTLIACLDSINRESQGVSTLRFHSFPLDHSFPPKKDNQGGKRYENHVVQGVLKTSWLHKHHHVLPSVVLALFDFKPQASAQEWAAQENKIAEEVHKLKRQLEVRECRRFIVLQEEGSTRLSESSLVEERLSSLRRRCELDSKSVIMLNTAEMTPGSQKMHWLEDKLRALSLEYYQLQAKRVKKHKRHINKTNQLALHVRHSFKIAHFYEFRRQTDKMLKHYSAAYKLVRDLLQVRSRALHPVGTGACCGYGGILVSWCARCCRCAAVGLLQRGSLWYGGSRQQAPGLAHGTRRGASGTSRQPPTYQRPLARSPTRPPARLPACPPARPTSVRPPAAPRGGGCCPPPQSKLVSEEEVKGVADIINYKLCSHRLAAMQVELDPDPRSGGCMRPLRPLNALRYWRVRYWRVVPGQAAPAQCRAPKPRWFDSNH
jgi:hypothetical protein